MWRSFREGFSYIEFGRDLLKAVISRHCTGLARAVRPVRALLHLHHVAFKTITTFIYILTFGYIAYVVNVIISLV